MHASFIPEYIKEFIISLENLEPSAIEQIVIALAELRAMKGRLFILGVGGSAATASHAVNDFRKICQIDAYAPTDNIAELTARTNDQGWESVFRDWLICSQLTAKDSLMILSVGGGSREHNLSVNLIEAIDLAKVRRSKIIALTGSDGGYAALTADISIRLPCQLPSFLTAFTESLHMVLCHLIVSHPLLKSSPTQWELIYDKNK